MPLAEKVADELLKSYARGVNDAADVAEQLCGGIKEGKILPHLDAETALQMLEKGLRELLAKQK